MKGYTIQNSIDLLEKNGTGSGGASSAADVSFDNTGTGLNASNVQTAIDELDLRGSFGSDEVIIGTRNGQPVYRKIIEVGALPKATRKEVAHGISNLDLTKIFRLDGTTYYSVSNYTQTIPYYNDTTEYSRLVVDDTNVIVITSTDMTAFDNTHIIMEYQKIVTTTKTRKKK